MGVFEQSRCMKAPHFVNWFCRSNNCPYSRQSQQIAEEQDRVFLEAQEADDKERINALRLPRASRKSYETPSHCLDITY